MADTAASPASSPVAAAPKKTKTAAKKNATAKSTAAKKAKAPSNHPMYIDMTIKAVQVRTENQICTDNGF